MGLKAQEIRPATPVVCCGATPLMKLVSVLLALAGLLASGWAATTPRAWFSVRDYGAVGDGQHLDTAGLNAAIAACARAGGGTVYVPPGAYLTGTVTLQSHVTLELDAGATLLLAHLLVPRIESAPSS